ncbi:MAG: hypothetical protein GY737_07735, partial [Desulfobacteraceae bacterium]|nr:hypothetical protein [Desulfobacteraceae bacterium]
GTLGTEIYIYVGWRLNTKIHTSCSKPIGPGLVSGDFEVLSGFSREGGELCPVNLPPPDDECGCEGKVTELTLKYNGDDAAVVKVEQRNEGTIFWRKLDPGDTFTITGKDKNGTLGTEIYIYVGWRLNTKIHTSCSKPIGPGLVSGDFEVLSGFSLKGGELCPL